jgi:hypothetical protein
MFMAEAESNQGIKRKGPCNANSPANHTESPNKFGYQLVSLGEWLAGSAEQQSAAAGPSPLPMVDLRTQSEYSTHCLLSTQVPIVNLPLSSLLSGERSCELPPRHVEFAILVPRDYISSFIASSEATSCDECIIHQLFFATKSKSTAQTRKPWLVRQILLESGEDFWVDAERLQLLVEETTSKHDEDDAESSECSTLFCKLPRLWKPDPLVCSDVLPMLKETIQQHMLTLNQQIDRTRVTGIVLDLGSGAGRDICFLAEELKDWHQSTFHQKMTSSTTDGDTLSANTQCPIQFVGIDNHKGSAKRCLPLWKYRGVQDITSSVSLNLEKLNEVADYFSSTIPFFSSTDAASDTFLCIYAIRYLNRKLLALLAHSSYKSTRQINEDTASQQQHFISTNHTSIRLPKGTIIAISHFCKPSSSTIWEFDHPKESQVLSRWELRDLFCSVCWEIVKDEICLDGDHGRSLIQFVAVKIV